MFECKLNLSRSLQLIRIVMLALSLLRKFVFVKGAVCKMKEILAIKALQTKRDLPATLKEVISINYDICCNTGGSLVDLTHQLLQFPLVLTSVKLWPLSGQDQAV